MGEEMPAATTDERRRSFDQMAQLYSRARGAPPPALFDAVAVFVSPPADALEIGCGPGNASLPLLERGFRIHAVELGENLTGLLDDRLGVLLHAGPDPLVADLRSLRAILLGAQPIEVRKHIERCAFRPS
jgi:hypothetical protein